MRRKVLARSGLGRSHSYFKESQYLILDFSLDPVCGVAYDCTSFIEVTWGNSKQILVPDGRGKLAYNQEKARNATSAQIDVRPVTPMVGAVVSGVSLAETGAEEAGMIRAALLKHKVLFFHGQDLNADEFLSYAEMFGPTTLHHPVTDVTKVSGEASEKARKNVWERDNSYRSDHWHTDVTFIDRPVSVSLLRCVTTPEFGGDTLFANTVSAYERMPAPLRAFADSLRALHSLSPGMRDRGWWGKGGHFDYLTEHPVVRVNSETGERSLMMGSFVEQIVGMDRETSAWLINIFQHHILRPENVVRWRWRPGDLAMWDNRSTQHYAANDYGDAERVMQRLTVAGGIPVGVDGRPSVALRGDASTFSSIGPA